MIQPPVNLTTLRSERIVVARFYFYAFSDSTLKGDLHLPRKHPAEAGYVFSPTWVQGHLCKSAFSHITQGQQMVHMTYINNTQVNQNQFLELQKLI